MRIVKNKYVWLLSLLWLAALGYCSFDALNGGANGAGRVSVSDTGHGQSGHSQDVDLFKHSARSLNRRVGLHSDLDDASNPAAVPGFQLFQPELVRMSSPQAEAPLGLANNWQFHWRTALEPRAPSPVSGSLPARFGMPV